MVMEQKVKQWLRKILLSVIILAGIVTVVLFYLIATLDIEAHRSKIESIISQSLNREVRIQGKIRLKISLWPYFVVEDISIGNPSWATVPYLARIKRFEIQVALLPLLRKELKILELKLIGADVHLERDKKGTPNWLMKGRDSGQLGAKALPAVLEMQVKNSTITFHVKERPPITLSIDELEATLGVNQTFRIEGNLIVKDILIGLTLHGGKLHQLFSRTSPWPIQGHILIDGLPIKLEGFITDPIELQKIRLKLATERDISDKLKSLFDGRLHEVGDLRINLEVTAIEAGHRVKIVSKASQLDLTKLITGKRIKPVSGAKIDSFESTFESDGRTINDIILNSRSSLFAKNIDVYWHTLNVKRSKILHIESIKMQAEPRQAMKVQIQSSFESVKAILTLKYDRIINLIWRDKPWPFQVRIQTEGVDAGITARVHQPLDKKHITGIINAKIANLGQLGKLFRQKLPSLGPLAATGKFELSNNHLHVSDIRGVFVRANVNGSMALILNKPAKVSLNLLVKGLDVENLRPKHDPDIGIFIKANNLKLVGEGSGNSISESFLRASWELTAQEGHMGWQSRTKSIQHNFNVSDFKVTSVQDQTMSLSLKSRHNDVVLQLYGKLGRLSELINREKPFPIALKVKADDMTAGFDGFLRKPLQDIRVEGGFEIQTDRVTTIAKLLGKNWQHNQTLSISGQLKYKPVRIHLGNVKLVTKGVSMAGEFIYTSDASPRFDIQLQNNVIDLAKYINQKDKTKNNTPSEKLTHKAQRVIPDFSVDSNLLKYLSIAVQIVDLKVMYGAERITTINAKLSIDKGMLTLQPLEGHSPTGSLTLASLILDTAVAPPQVALSWNTKNLDYGLILNDLKITKDVVGTLDLKLDLKGQGLSLRELIGNANGTLEIVADKGRIPKWALEVWGGGLVRLLIPTTWFEKDVTDLNCAVSRFNINDGIMHSNVLLADTERVTVAGETVLDLKTEKISGLFQPKNKKATLLRLGTPIKVRGTLAKIKVEPAQSTIVTMGKLILGLSYPGSLILLFGDLGTAEKNPCKALLDLSLPRGQHGEENQTE
jgi:uncharacterized protein involved in outer membrane biogenesis